MNFGEDRVVCNNQLVGEPCGLKKPEFEKYSVRPVRSQDHRRDGDWDCWACGNVNFKIRDSCNKCKLTKEAAQDDGLR